MSNSKTSEKKWIKSPNMTWNKTTSASYFSSIVLSSPAKSHILFNAESVHYPNYDQMNVQERFNNSKIDLYSDIT